jgi:16S rRNA (cytosine967-C5)-methyltransferase
LRRDPDIKWSRQPGDLPRLAAEQLVMLRHAAGAVRPGGRLVYATCSSEPDENDDVVERFLAEEADFVAAATPVGAVPPQLLDARGRLTTLPPRDRLDAFYAAVLVRQPAA